MIVEPKIRGFLCTTAHPSGCEKNVCDQIDLVRSNLTTTTKAPKNVLVIGASTGYGLSSRIAAGFGFNANTLGIIFERPASGSRTASAGWYNTAAFEKHASNLGGYHRTINGDAFSDEVKQKVIEEVKAGNIGKFDLVIYSLAAPRRNDPRSGESFSSVLKPIGGSFSSKTVDVMTGKVSEVTLEPASDDEINNTVKVMGGEDWQWWMEDLANAGVLADDVNTVAYSYIGPDLTHSIYRSGTIGHAKEDLESRAGLITEALAKQNGKAYVSVNKAVVTQASAAIPVVPLYMSILLKVMKEKGNNEGCIEQIIRMFNDRLCQDDVPVDDKSRIRLDDWEMEQDIQDKVESIWPEITTDTLESATDIAGYKEEFYRLFGFKVPGVNYEQDVEVNLDINLL